MSKKNYYLGIDLGTTNSCMAYGTIDAYSQKLVPEVISTQMQGTAMAQPIVPSVVMYGEEQVSPIELGLHTKEQMRLGSVDLNKVVIRSAKLQMGQKTLKEAPWLSPEQVSAAILTFLKANAERRLRQAQNSVVIGVPACFDSDMWAATKRAAQMAGFTSVRLIDEPKAALLDFIREQERSAPEWRVLDFNEPKTICVFDPGGGTIDVSVVKVKQIPVKKGKRTVYEMHYEDLGLTREPFLGGDDFDRLLANFLANKFLEQTGVDIDEIEDEKHNVFARGKLMEYAEAAKKQLTDEVFELTTFADLSEQEAMEQAAVDVTIPFLYRTYSLIYNLTYREYIDIVSPLLGFHLNISDINNSEIQRKLANQEDYIKSENLLMPILDALWKAKVKTGEIPVVDMVLTNGGMSKLPVIRQRLNGFFGNHVPIVETPSPDLSVAKGATIHHYNVIHGLDRTSNLLPEAISLETRGGFIPLVPANTKYPTGEPIIPKGFEFVIPRDGIPFLDIPLWRGEPPRPTKRLEDRRIFFKDSPVQPQKGDVVKMYITIDSNRQLKLEAWLRDKPNVRFEVSTAMA